MPITAVNLVRVLLLEYLPTPALGVLRVVDKILTYSSGHSNPLILCYAHSSPPSLHAGRGT